jgi:hypothetical protein
MRQRPSDPGSDWVHAFVQANLLVVGYNAWSGYRTGERGAVVCSTNTANEMGYCTYYVPRSRLPRFLRAWLGSDQAGAYQAILQATEAYNPDSDAILLLEVGERLWYYYLSKLAIPPPDCYAQLDCRRAEFDRCTP